jgi:hypothetical protein
MSVGVETETAAHLIAGCSFATGFWQQVGIDLREADAGGLWNVSPPAHVPTAFQRLPPPILWRGLTNLVNFIEIHQNSTDSVPPNFKIGDFTIQRFKIFKKYVKKLE